MNLKKTWKILILAVSIFIFFMPLLRLILISFKVDGAWGLNNYISLLSNVKTWRVIYNTLFIACLSTIISLVLGVSIAWIVAYSDIKSKSILSLMIIFPFIIPSYIISLSWTQFMSVNGFFQKFLNLLPFNLQPMNMYSFTGIILMMGITHYPLVYLLTVNVFRKIPRDLEWSARTCGNNSLEVFYKINLPLAMPGIVGGGFLAFLASIDNFGIPAFLGVPAGIKVMSTYIYEEIVGFGPMAFSRGASLSVILGIIALIGGGIQGLFLKKNSRLDTIKEDHSIRFSFGKYRKAVEITIWSFLIIISVVPIISMLSTSFIKAYGMDFMLENLTLKHYKFILFESIKTRRALINSFLLAMTSTIACIVLGTTIAYFKVRRPSKSMSLVESIISLPYAIPGIVLALAMIFHWIQPIPGWKPGIYGTTKILVVAYITRYLILQVKSSFTAILQLDQSLEEAARVCGALSFSRWKNIITPLILPSVLSGSFLVLVSSLTEITLSSLLWSSGSETIGITISNFEQAGFTNYSTAFSSIVILFIIIGFILLRILPSLELKHMLRRVDKKVVAKAPVLELNK